MVQTSGTVIDRDVLIYGERDPFVSPSVVCAEMDTVGPWPVTIDVSHHQIHEGDMSRCQHVAAALSTNDVASVYITCPSGSYPHLVPYVTTLGAARVDFFSSATISDSGTALTKYAANLNLEDKTYVTFQSSATLSASGTMLPASYYTGGTNTRSAGGSRSDSEWVLHAGNTYLLRVTSLTTGNAATIKMEFYEEGAYARA